MDRMIKGTDGKFIKHETLNTCSIPDCDGPVRGFGYCNKHYLRFTRYGDPLFRKKVANGEGKEYIGNHGYRVLIIDGKRVLEHRHVMEIHTGRKLGKNEIVHHLDGDKLNNALENLVVLDRSVHIQEHPDVIAFLKLGPQSQRRGTVINPR